MEVILLKDVDKLGSSDEIVKVRDGYGRNYLIPKGLAVEAKGPAVKQLNEKLKVIAKKQEDLLIQINTVISKLESAKVVLKTKVGVSGRIFGSITNVMLAKELKNQTGFEIDRKSIVFPENISEVGLFKGEVHFTKDKKASFEFEVASE